MSELKRSKQDAIAAVARRNAVRELSLWYVSFFAVERGKLVSARGSSSSGTWDATSARSRSFH
jgi:hypothetical protein